MSNSPPDTNADILYRELKPPRSRSVLLALTVPDEAAQIHARGTSVRWSKEATEAFRQLHRQDPGQRSNVELPFASLRSSIEVRLGDALMIERQLKLSRYELFDARNNSHEPFAYFEANDTPRVVAALYSIVSDWVASWLEPWCVKLLELPADPCADLIALIRSERLIDAGAFEAPVAPWEWEAASGTARHWKRFPYRTLEAWAAKLLAGKELFAGKGPMRRCIPGTGDDSTLLVTVPHNGDDNPWSLSLRLRLVTMPGVHQPLLLVEVGKRRWTKALLERRNYRQRMRGTVFSTDHPDRCFDFSARGEPSTVGWRHTLGLDFEAVRTALKLPLDVVDVDQLVRGDADTANASCYLTHRNGRSKHEVGAGVLPRDKLEGFECVCAALKIYGFEPFKDFKVDELRRHSGGHEDTSRVADASALLRKMISKEQRRKGDAEAPARARGWAAALRKTFGLSQSDVIGGKTLFAESAKDKTSNALTLEKLVAANKATLRALYSDERARLLLWYDEQATSKDDRRLLKATLHALWPGLKIEESRLPRGTHGTAEMLREHDRTSANAKPQARAKARAEAWQSARKIVAQYKKPQLSLVFAPKFYEGGRDDYVNKPSTRRALASAGSPTQFLQPMDRYKNGLVDPVNFLIRIQAAMRDLVSADAGRFVNVEKPIERCFHEKSTRPAVVIGISLVRKNRSQRKGNLASSIVVATRLDIATGQCSLKYACEGPTGKLAISAWMPLAPDGLAAVARLSPARLAKDWSEQSTRYMRFVDEVITESVDAGNQPVVLIDSINASRLWPWLTDAKISPTNIKLNEKEWMEQTWQGARVVRIRTGYTPSLIEDKQVRLARTTRDDTRACESCSEERMLSVPTAPPGRLLRLGSASNKGCHVFFSSTRTSLYRGKRGVSCYRPSLLTEQYRRTIGADKELVRNRAGRQMLQVVSRDPVVEHSPSPRLLEISVALWQDSDSPDKIADFVDRLRYGFAHYGEGATLPAPMFFERVVGKYVSEWQVESPPDEEEDGEGEEELGTW